MFMASILLEKLERNTLSMAILFCFFLFNPTVVFGRIFFLDLISFPFILFGWNKTCSLVRMLKLNESINSFTPSKQKISVFLHKMDLHFPRKKGKEFDNILPNNIADSFFALVYSLRKTFKLWV